MAPWPRSKRARDKIRATKQTGPLPAGGVAVVLRGGTYFLPQTFQLGQPDSGTADAPVVYRAAEGEKVILVGGRPITGFVPYRGSILKADVAGQGLKGVNFRQLFFDGKRQHLARWPNFDPQNPYGGGWAYADGKSDSHGGKISPTKTAAHFQYKEKDARNWSRPEEGEVFVFPRFNWWNNILPIAAIDRNKRTLTFSRDASYAIRAVAIAIMCVICSRNSTHRASGISTARPRRSTFGRRRRWKESPSMRRRFALSSKSVQARRTSCFAAWCWSVAKGTAVLLKGTSDCLIAGNTIRNVGDYNGTGVGIIGDKRNGVVGNDIYEVGHYGNYAHRRRPTHAHSSRELCR